MIYQIVSIYIVRNIYSHFQMFFENVKIVPQWFFLEMKFVGLEENS